MTPPDRLRMLDIRRSTTFRLAFLFGILFTLGTVALVGVIYAMTAHELTIRSDQILRFEASRLQAVHESDLPQQIREEVSHNEHGLNFFALIASDGRYLDGNLKVGGLLDDHPADVDVPALGRPLRILKVSTSYGYQILLGRDISEIRHLLQRLKLIIFLSCLSITPSVLLVGAALSVRPFRRVAHFRHASRLIASGKFDVRMPVSQRNDELDQMANMANVMVDDIERVVAQVKSVTDAIAHDLRTPLTRVRTRLDQARAGLDPSSDRAAFIEDLTGDLDLVLERFGALLRIAELEASEQRAGFGMVNVSQLLETLSELYLPVAEDAGIALSVWTQPGLYIHGDKNLLLEAAGNLLDNAIKFASSTVRLSSFVSGTTITIAVSDDGPGISPEERKAVLQRFYRGSKSPGRAGVGLGLSVTTAILHLHKYRLQLSDGTQGLEARVEMDVEAASA